MVRYLSSKKKHLFSLCDWKLCLLQHWFIMRHILLFILSIKPSIANWYDNNALLYFICYGNKLRNRYPNLLYVDSQISSNRMPVEYSLYPPIFYLCNSSLRSYGATLQCSNDSFPAPLLKITQKPKNSILYVFPTNIY